MILYREKEDDKPEKQRKKNMDTTVNVDFAKGTTVADALEQKGDFAQAWYTNFQQS
jgi:hypothetical protein